MHHVNIIKKIIIDGNADIEISIPHAHEREREKEGGRNRIERQRHLAIKNYFFVFIYVDEIVFFLNGVYPDVNNFSKHFCIYACVHERVTVFCCIHI